jgi:hypothetical protein
MTKHRKNIENIKANLQDDILSNINKYKHAVIRFIDKEYRKQSGSDLEKFAANVQKRLSIPKDIQTEILTGLQKSQNNIANIWDEYFFNETKNNYSLSSNDYEKIQSVYQIEFSEIEKEISDKVLREVQRSVKAGYGFKVIRNRLEQSGLGFYTAENLATTALSQFDNAYHTEIAQQAGAEYYLYDGSLQKNSRSFCVNHVGRVYTLGELAAMSNGQGLPVATSLGGYRCRHFITALINYVRKSYGEKFNPVNFKEAV